MKKLLGIVVLGLLLSGNANANLIELENCFEGKYFWDYKNCKSYSNIEIRFLAKRNNKKGFKFATDDGIEPETGYLRPLMIVVMDNRK